jgi:hypothetical protein
MASTALVAFASGVSAAGLELGEDETFGAFERLRAEDMGELEDEAEGAEAWPPVFHNQPATASPAASKATTRMTMIALRMRVCRR